MSQEGYQQVIYHKGASEKMRRSLAARAAARGVLVMSRVLFWAVRYFNPVARFILAGRFHVLLSSRLMLLTFTGRRTGRSFTTPVSYVRERSSLLVPGGGAWWKNLEDGQQVQARLRGTWRSVTPELITEPVALAEVLQEMLVVNPAISAFTGVLQGHDGRPDAEALERERRRGFVVVRLRLGADRGFAGADRTAQPADHAEALTRQAS